MPSTETNPARRPCDALRVMMYTTEGPGTTSSASAAAANRPSVAGSGIRHPDTLGPAYSTEIRSITRCSRSIAAR